MPKVRKVSVRRTKTNAATVSSAQPATMVLPDFADNQSQMAQQCSSAPLETPGSMVIPYPSVHDTLGVNISSSNRVSQSSLEASGLNLFILFKGCVLISGCHLGHCNIIVVFVVWPFGLVELFGLVHICCHLGLYNFVGHLGRQITIIM